MKLTNKQLKLIVVFLLIGILVLVVKDLPIYNREKLLSFFFTLKDNPNAGIIFILFTAFLTVFFVPISWFTIMAGIIFGFVKGFIYLIPASIISCIISFLLGRFFKGDFEYFIYSKIYKNNWKIDLKKIESKIEESGFNYIFLLRNIPLLPFTAVNYLSGITSIKFKDYLLGSFLGMIPSMSIALYFLSKTINLQNNLKEVLYAAILVLVYYGIILFLKKKLENQN